MLALKDFKSKNSLGETFLFARKFRLIRHLILIGIITIVVFQGFLFSYGFRFGWNLITFMNLVIVIAFWGLSCLNMYILIPRILFRNKFSTYVTWWLALVIFVVMLIIIAVYFVESYYHIPDKIIKFDYNILIFFSINVFAVGFYLFAFSITTFLQRWMIHNQQLQEMEKSKVASELKQLKDLIQPEFLSRALNNANTLVSRNSDMASSLLLKLSHLLRYQLYDSTRDKVLLNSDISFIQDYLNLEKIQRDNFNFSISTKGTDHQLLLPPLLFIPIIVNAIKHLPDTKIPHTISIHFNINDKELHFECNSPANDSQHTRNELHNLYRRLDLLYGENYSLQTKQNMNIQNTELQLYL